MKLSITDQDIENYLQKNNWLKAGVYGTASARNKLVFGTAYVVLYVGEEYIEIHSMGEYSAQTKAITRYAHADILKLTIRRKLLANVVVIKLDNNAVVRIRLSKFVLGHHSHKKRLRNLLDVLNTYWVK